MRRNFTSALRRMAHATAVASAANGIMFSRRCASSDTVVPPERPLHINDNFLSGASAMYMENLYQQWKKDPSSVDESWSAVFGNYFLNDFEQPLFDQPMVVLPAKVNTPLVSASSVGDDIQLSLMDCSRAMQMIYAFEEHGHLHADLDPLEFNKVLEASPAPPSELISAIDPSSLTKDFKERMPMNMHPDQIDLSLEAFGFTPEDAQRRFAVHFSGMAGGIRSEPHDMTLEELHHYLKEWYCGKVGYEFSYVTDPDIKRYLRSQVENIRDQTILRRRFNADEKKQLLGTVGRAYFFEDFFKRKFTTAKRFGSDGSETLIVGLRQLIHTVANHGVEQVNLCMAHRGRLNVLANVIGKPFEVMLKEFVGLRAEDIKPFNMQSDVKYHLGSRGKFVTRDGRVLQMELLCNPSHLEAVNPVNQGYTKATQRLYSVTDGNRHVVPIEVHGDAAFSGQGVAFESMAISEVGEYSTGGTIHVVCNNQIGFTTNPRESRSSPHCTALGKAFGCPIIHVNGDSPEDVARVFEFAAEFRLAFRKSIIIDLVGYRRYGHNENDDPSITQPLLYKHIQNFPDVFQRYGNQLINEGVMTKDEVDNVATEKREYYNNLQKQAAPVNYSQYLLDSIPPQWKGMKYSNELGKVTLEPTAITKEVTEEVLKALSTYPEGFQIHSKLVGVLERRNESIRTGEGLDWGAAEALAFGSLLKEGMEIRLMGQDVQRGTFSHRHAVLHDTNTDATYAPLSALQQVPGQFSVLNSPLSEFGTLGYAAGYSIANPKALTIWEAQYGDFANGATIIFDQFLSAGEDKWNQQQACVVNLPHGYDGKGPEHSSGRLERLLQMSSEEVNTPAMSKELRLHSVNWEVVYPSTPAQYFHLLRRHMKRNFRKALNIFYSKQFLRAPNVSSIAEFQGDSSFLSVIGDPTVDPAKCKRVVFCTGQLYFFLEKHRETHKIKDVALIRIEELSPFPRMEVEEILQKHPKAELVWAQEEPKNMGAWNHVEPRLTLYTKGQRPIRFAGRATSSSPSTGYSKRHEAEQLYICQSALESF